MLSASSSDRKSNPRTVNPSSMEAEAPSLPAGKKASGKSAERVRTLREHEPLNPDATTIVPTIFSPSSVAEATVNGDDQEAPTDPGYNDMHVGRGRLREMEEAQVELLRRQKQATKDVKAASRKIRDAMRLQASHAQTQDMGTPRAAGTRSTVQTTCVVGLMPGADGQAAAEGVLSNPWSAEGGERKRNPAQADVQLESLQEASRQRILPPAEPTGEPASGRSAGELARLFQQTANFSEQPAGGDPKILSPTAAVAPEKTPKRSRGTPSKPPAERLQARHVPTLPEILSAQVDMEAYERAVAQGQLARWEQAPPLSRGRCE